MLSSIDAVWKETLWVPPSDLVPMWGQMAGSVDCCGFFLAHKSVTNWHVARHGSLQYKEELQTRAADQEAPH